MIKLCNKLKEMVKDEKKGSKEYLKLKAEMEKKDVCIDCIERIGKIAEDEDEHRHDLKVIMKVLDCK